MPLTLLKGWNLPENGTGRARPLTLYQYGTERGGKVNNRIDAL